MSYQPPELCDVKWIASYVGKSKSSVLQRITKLPGFPEPIPGCDRPLKYVKKDVVDFLTHRAARP